MDEQEVCTSCRDPVMTKRFCELLTGNVTDIFFRELTKKADNKTISDEEYFGTLVTKYGEAAVTNAVMTTAKEFSTIQAEAEKKEVAQKKVAHAAPPQQKKGGAVSTPAASPASKDKNEDKDKDKNKPGKPLTGFKQIGTSKIKDLCSACVSPALLGAGISISGWFPVGGEDHKYMLELCEKLEKEELAVEEFIAETFIKWGISSLHAWNRIFDDINIAFVVGKEIALEKRPDLKDIPPLEWGDVSADKEIQKLQDEERKKEAAEAEKKKTEEGKKPEKKEDVKKKKR